MPNIDFDEPAFLSALNNGLGITGAARTILWHPKQVTKYIRNKPQFEKECNEAIKLNYQALVVLGNDYYNKRKFEQWKTNMEYIRIFKSELVFWESFEKKKKVINDHEMIYKAWHEYQDMDEMLTAIGFEKREFVDLVFANKPLLKYFTGKM